VKVPADADISDYLATQGHGTVGTNIFTGWMPDSPDVAISVMQTAGGPPMVHPSTMEYPNVQVLVRHTSYDSGWTLINNIYDDLHGLANTTINTRVYSIQALAAPVKIAEDAKDRVMFSCNFRIYKTIE